MEPTARSTLLVLNDDCLLHLCKYFEIKDFINLTKTCQRMKYIDVSAYRRFSVLTVDHSLIQEGADYVDLFFGHIGQHISKLIVDFKSVGSTSNVFRNIRNRCSNLREVVMKTWHLNSMENILEINSTQNVTCVTFYRCSFESNKSHFFNSLRNLKIFHVVACVGIDESDLKTIFKNNSSIESFIFSHSGLLSDFQLLGLIPNLEKLCGEVEPANHELQLNPLLKVNRLKNLILPGFGNDVNKDFLAKLAKKDILTSLELDGIRVDNKFFELMKSFKKIQFLTISPSNYNFELKPTFDWPPNTKHLRLRKFTITLSGLIALTRLKHVENIDMKYCQVADGEQMHFNDFMELSKRIYEAISFSENQRRLTVILPMKYAINRDYTKKYIIDLPHLRILNNIIFERNHPIPLRFPLTQSPSWPLNDGIMED